MSLLPFTTKQRAHLTRRRARRYKVTLTKLRLRMAAVSCARWVDVVHGAMKTLLKLSAFALLKLSAFTFSSEFFLSIEFFRASSSPAARFLSKEFCLERSIELCRELAGELTADGECMLSTTTWNPPFCTGMMPFAGGLPLASCVPAIEPAALKRTQVKKNSKDETAGR